MVINASEETVILCLCIAAHGTNCTATVMTEMDEDDEEMTDEEETADEEEMADHYHHHHHHGQENVVAPVVGGVVAVTIAVIIAVVIIAWMFTRSYRNRSATMSATGYVHCISSRVLMNNKWVGLVLDIILYSSCCN